MSRIYLAYRSKKQRFCAVQAFCAAKPWRRANSLRPSILISCWNQKEVTTYVVTSFWSGRRGSLAALPCRDTHSGHQTPHWGVFSLRSRPVRPSARWSQKKSALLRRTSVCAAKPWRRANSLRPSILISCRNQKEVTTYVVTSFLERATRLELATSTLARWRSTR